MPHRLHAIAEQLARLGYASAIVGANEISTDAPDETCRRVVENYDSFARRDNPGEPSPIVRRGIPRRKTAAPAAKPKRRRKTTAQLKRKLRGSRVKKTAMLRRISKGRPTGGAYTRAWRAEHATMNAISRRPKRAKRKRTTKRRGKKTWTQAARQAFARKMPDARAFYRKAKR